MYHWSFERQKNKTTQPHHKAIVLCPPVKVASTDYTVEDEADEHCGHVVNGGRGRHEAIAVEGNCEIDLLEETYSELLVQYPL